MEEAGSEVLDKESNEMLALLVQYLAAMKVAQALNVECVTCDVHQGDKLGSSVAGELSRRKYDAIVSVSPKA